MLRVIQKSMILDFKYHITQSDRTGGLPLSKAASLESVRNLLHNLSELTEFEQGAFL